MFESLVKELREVMEEVFCDEEELALFIQRNGIMSEEPWPVPMKTLMKLQGTVNTLSSLLLAKRGSK
jgi:hypothetical protein